MPPATPVYFQKPPTTSPIPPQPHPASDNSTSAQDDSQSRGHHQSSPPRPLLRLHLDDLGHPATAAFLAALSPPALLEQSTAIVLNLLYDVPLAQQQASHAADAPTPSSSSSPSANASTSPWPPVRSVTLLLRPIAGVAYTTSLDLDADHKEIHLALGHVEAAARSGRLAAEITGVAVHEMVHVWQAYADDAGIPGGLTEGVADWVRLRAGLQPPHWSREAGAHGRAWDDGYETTAWFLDWLERHCERGGPGTVPRCNAMLRRLGPRKYDEQTFWMELCGKDVNELWDEYTAWLEIEQRQA